MIPVVPNTAPCTTCMIHAVRHDKRRMDKVEEEEEVVTFVEV